MPYIKLAPILQEYADNQEAMVVEGTTVRECINNLVMKYPEIQRWIVDSINTPLVIVLNNELISQHNMDKEVTGSDKIELITMIQGG